MEARDPAPSSEEPFSTEQLFAAAASGDVMKLDGLHQYLHDSNRKLSDSSCEPPSPSLTVM